jgi:hypothetical protein
MSKLLINVLGSAYEYTKVKLELDNISESFEGELYDAIRMKNYLYLYLTDWKFKEQRVKEIDGNCYFMDDMEMESLMTILYNFYKTARTGSSTILKHKRISCSDSEKNN